MLSQCVKFEYSQEIEEKKIHFLQIRSKKKEKVTIKKMNEWIQYGYEILKFWLICFCFDSKKIDENNDFPPEIYL